MRTKDIIELRSDTMDEATLKNKRAKVAKWQEEGHTVMAIMFYLSRECQDVSGTREGSNKFVINIK